MPVSPPNVLRATGSDGGVAFLEKALPGVPSHVVVSAHVRVDALFNGSSNGAALLGVGCTCAPPYCSPARTIRAGIKLTPDYAIHPASSEVSAGNAFAQLAQAKWVELRIDATLAATGNTYVVSSDLQSATIQHDATSKCTGDVSVRLGPQLTPGQATFVISYDDVTIDQN